MANFPGGIPSAADYLPDWTSKRIVFLERSHRWAPAVETELRSSGGSALPQFSIDSCAVAREASQLLELKNSIGLVLFLDGIERDCLDLLGRVARSFREFPVLAVGLTPHRGLMPVLMESGVQSILFDPFDDVSIADWCLGVIRHSRGGVRT